MVFNATFNNILAISWQSVLFVEETSVPRENHRSVARHWQTLSHHVVSIDKKSFLYQSSWFTTGPKSNAFNYFFGSLKLHWNYLDLQSKFLQMLFSLNIFYLLKCAKRIRHKLNKLMKSSPIYNKLQHYLIEHACI